jgi:NAD+ diphosphatase
MDNYRHSLWNHFATWYIDRVADKRRDDKWLAAQLKDERTRFIPVWKLKNLFTVEQVPEPILLSPHEVQNLVPAAGSAILLGVKGGRTYFAIGLPSQQASPPIGLGQFQDLRQIAPLLDEPDGALLAYARAMTYWHERHRFCGDCGSPTTSVEGGHVRICTNDQCGQHHFPRTDPAIIVLVTLGERCLLGRQPTWREGLYSTIAGFVEPGESLENAVIREVQEETGVKVKETFYHSSQPWPFPSSLMLGFTAVAANETIQVHDELEKAGWFTRRELHSKLKEGHLKLPSPVSISYRLIEDWFDAGSLGPLRGV